MENGTKLLRTAVVLFVGLCVPAGTLAAGTDKAGPTLARDSEALAKIVIPAEPPGAVQFAAIELRDYLRRVTGAPFEVTSTDPGAPPRIYVGDSAAARAAGLDVSTLKRDGFFRGVVGQDLYILGRDDPDKRWKRGGWVETFRNEHGTVTGVYDFLEDICQVRWFMPGKRGEVVPRIERITVPEGIIEEAPVFIERRIDQPGVFGYWYPDADEVVGSQEEQFLWLLRQRYSTTIPVSGCHSATYLKFGERFGEEHPEWFSLRADGTRAIKTGYGPHLCWSQPEVIDAFVKDARAYFTGQPPESRGLKKWPSFFSATEFMVDPSDGYTKCRCDRCQTTLGKYPGQGYSEIMFAAVAKVAESVKDLEGKVITTLAYGAKRLPPQSVPLPDNVRVRLCISGPVAAIKPLAHQTQMELIRQWSERMSGNLCLWTYPNTSWYKGLGVVETMPHAAAKFLRDARPYVRGVFFENEAINHTYRLLDCYLLLRLAWDPAQDVDALLADYFSKCYGPAAGPIGAMYGRLEELWIKTFTFYPESDHGDNLSAGGSYTIPGSIDIWEKVYSKAELEQFGAWMDEAETKAADHPEVAARVAILRKWLYGTLKRQRDSFVQSLGGLETPQATCHLAPVAAGPDGLLPASAWQAAPWQRLDGAREHGMQVITRFKTLWRDGTFFFYADLQEPLLERSGTAADRQADDPQLWQDNDVEIFFATHDGGKYSYQILINDRGVVADNARKYGRVDGRDRTWDSHAKVRVNRPAGGWTAELAMPLKSFGIDDPIVAESYGLHVIRYRVIQDQLAEVYAWSTNAVSGQAETHLYGALTFVATSPPRVGDNLVKNGSFEQPGTERQPLAGWHVSAKQRPAVARDFRTRWDGEAALKFEADKGTTAGLYYYLPTLKPATTYRFRCRVKTEDVRAIVGRALNGVRVNFAAPGFNNHVPTPALRGTRDWRTIEFNAKTTEVFEPDARFYIILTIDNATGRAWFDDVSVQEVLGGTTTQ